MNYQTFLPNSDLSSMIKYHWTLDILPDINFKKQRIIPDGCMELIFLLGDDIKRFVSKDEFIIQPRSMVLGHITEPFTIQPVGYISCFSTCFYPYGLFNFIKTPLNNLKNKETPIAELFGKTTAYEIEQKIINATDSQQRIEIVETFLLKKLYETSTIDHIVKSTIETLLITSGSSSIRAILNEDLTKRRQLERNFLKQIGISPKQLGKVIRLQTALKLLLNRKTENLTEIAYESEYYDQNHFIKDFKEFTGITPKEFLSDDQMIISTLFYSKG